MPQVELVFLGKVHGTFVDSDLQKDSSSPFSSCLSKLKIQPVPNNQL